MLTIDVQPDFRVTLLILVEQCSKMYEQLHNVREADISPASLLGYCLAHLYNAAAFNDCYRMVQSPATAAFYNETKHEHFMNIITWMYAPAFIADQLQSIQCTFDPQRNNLGFIYSFACFSFPHDLGTVLPRSSHIAIQKALCL